jgi:hypothetical protein
MRSASKRHSCSFLILSAAAMVSSQWQATRRVRLCCFAKTMEKVPSVRAQPQFTKVRDIQKLRYISAQIGFSAGYQHRLSAKVALRGRCGRDFAKNQLRSGFPVFKVCAMRSCVLRSPQRLTKASRSRSRTYCSGTSCGAVMEPPARMEPSLRPTTPS